MRLVSFPSRTVLLLTRHSWLKTGLPPTAVNLLANTNDHAPNSPGVNLLDYYVWVVMLEHYKTFYPKLKNTDGLKKVCVKLRLDQQGHTELHKKSLSLCESWDGHLERALRKKCLATLNVTRR